MPISNELRTTKADRTDRLREYAIAAGEAIQGDKPDLETLHYVLGRVERDAQDAYHDGERTLRNLIASYLGYATDPHANDNALERLDDLMATKVIENPADQPDEAF